MYIKYGIYFDSLNPDNDGNGTLDGDEVFGQTKEQEVQTQDEAITEVIVDMKTNGNIDRNPTVESMQGIDAMSTNVYALIGELFNFTTTSSFESATITFKIDQSKLGDTLFDNLVILWYNEEKQIFEEMPTTCDAVNSTVSTTTTHFSQYMVVDSVKWYENWQNSINLLRDNMCIGGATYQRSLNTIFLLDCSYCMETVDSITYSIEIGYNGVTEDNYYKIVSDMDSPGDIEAAYKKYGRRICNRTTICENIIDNMSANDKAAVITFADGSSSTVTTQAGLLNKTAPNLKQALQSVNNDGELANLNTAVDRALTFVNASDTANYRIIILTHSDITFGSALWNYDWNNVAVNIVNLGPGSISTSVENFVNYAGGEVYNAISASNLTYQVGDLVYTPPQFISTDSDGDTIPDFVELYGLKPNGDPIGTDPNLIDSDGDTIPDNVELKYLGEQLTSALTLEQYLAAIYCGSDPANPDMDGYDDANDANPQKQFDQRFFAVDDYNYIPTIDFVERHYSNGKDCYDTKSDDKCILLEYEYRCFATAGLTNLLSVVEKGNIKDPTYLTGSNNYYMLLSWYLNGSGEPYNFTTKNLFDIIWTHRANTEHYSHNINQIKNAMQEILVPKNDSSNPIILSTKDDSIFKLACYKGHNCETHNPTNTDSSGYYYDTSMAADFGFSLGESLCGMTGLAYIEDGIYHLNLRYYLIDTYEYAVHWDDC